MDETKETGVDYPEIELGGEKYPVKFTRGTLYRLSKAGIAFNPTFLKGGASVQLSNLIDTLHLVIQYPGTAEELTELVYDRRDEISGVLIEAWGKVVLPSLQAKIAALQMAAKPEALQKPN